MTDTTEYEIAIDRTAAPAPEAAEAEALLDELADAGILPDLDGDDRAAAVGMIEDFLEGAAERRLRAEILPFLKRLADAIERLPNTPAGRTALLRYLRGDNSRSYRQEAQRLGIGKSQVAAWSNFLELRLKTGHLAPL